MAIATTITLSGIIYNVYGLTADPLKDANDYMGARVGTASWTTANSKLRQQAIISAARMIDRRPKFSGTKTVGAQALEWPRDSATCDGVAVTDNTIPDNIAIGEFELALALIEDEAIQDSQGTGSNVKKAKAGSAEVTFFVPTEGTSSEKLFPQVVHELIACYFIGSNTSLGAPFANGVDATVADQGSEFCSTNNSYNVSEGHP